MPKKKTDKLRKILLKSLFITIVFVFLDFLVHTFFKPLTITITKYYYISTNNPLINYSIGKFITTFILLAILLYLFRNNFMNMAGVISLIVIGFLELSYILYHFSGWQWHILNLINHYLTLMAGFLFVDNSMEKKKWLK